MAYVAITKELINRVEGMIKVMRNNEVNSTCPELNKDYNIDASHIYNLSTWGAEHVHLMDAIPKDWLAKQDNSYITVVGELRVEDLVLNIKKQLRFNGMTMAYARPSKDYWNRTSGEIHIDALRSMHELIPGRTECIERFMDACTEAEIDAKWNNVKLEIVSFLKKCKSLNEAIKLLPNLRMYLAREDIERLEKKVKRAPRKELAADLDVGGITAAAVAARLMSSV